jgi:hypothetical protein
MPLVAMSLVPSGPFLPGFGFVNLNVEIVFMITGDSSLVRMWSRELSLQWSKGTHEGDIRRVKAWTDIVMNAQT